MIEAHDHLSYGNHLPLTSLSTLKKGVHYDPMAEIK